MAESPLQRPPGEEYVREAIWSRKRHHFSPVWIVPIVALIIGAVLVWQNLSQRGPAVQILFKSAAGITPGKSVVKYKDVIVGKVEDVRFSDDLGSVIVTARLTKEMRPYLSEKTLFWIVHARLSADSVEGLDTLLSGAYISMDPHKGKESVRRFKGLVNPPVITDRTPGKRFILEAQSKGSLQIGSPVYYKQLKAGTVVSYHLAPNGRTVLIDVFIQKPFSDLITDTTRFWNASGIDAHIGADGVEIRTESLTAILSGGIAFDNFEVFGPGSRVQDGHHFVLYNTIKEARKVTYTRELYFWVYFNESVRGLKAGAPVEFRGVKVGEVVNLFLVGDVKTANFKIPILIKIEPERFTITGRERNASKGMDPKVFKALVDKGLRAQLQSANLLTGSLLINLDFHPDAPKANLIKENGLYVFPSVPATIETLKNNVQSILNNLAAIPFKEIGEETRQILGDVRQKTLPGFDATLQGVNRELLPSFVKLIDQSNQTLEEIRKNYLDTNAQIHRQMLKLMNEIEETSRSIRELSNYLNRHPESLIRGR
ncbi:intermembrane transport protein PqiB [Nitratifractor salsuginis]|uniref:Mammalian cell entry related domain protein n=1 Tax=Nitratifractor salsuginis (strain DSM 16511 / JCM 12458 / E9I37-1) TaxID=749222 RepID=E6X0T4_NITSE|nr:MlaD family protein [Nitratifractor salsuginis]ADV46866.1 Mammalian cell entry related domain protein [Nitratifractor salsuginis DSM 16511]